MILVIFEGSFTLQKLYKITVGGLNEQVRNIKSLGTKGFS